MTEAQKEREELHEEELQTDITDVNNEATDEVVADAENIAEEEPTAEPSVEERLAQALAMVDELKTQALYKQAEFENYRKRTLKEKTDLILNGAEKTVTAFLPVMDDFERALQNMEKADDVASVREGVELIFQKFNKTLQSLGVTPIVTDDADFDVDVHEAIAQIPAPTDEQKGKVIDCVQRGYKLNEKVIRHAKVAVGV